MNNSISPDILHPHGARLAKTHLRDLFNNDANRFDNFSLSLDDLLLDYSKEKIDSEAIQGLIDFATKKQLHEKIKSLFAGEPINKSEARAALHMVMRDSDNSSYISHQDHAKTLFKQFLSFADAIRMGDITAYDGKPFTDVISIGIGGSYLGPLMATHALKAYSGGLNIHYLHNIDGTNFHDITDSLDPARTLMIIQSKTFTTAETMQNARSCYQWLQNKLGNHDASKHCVAVTTQTEKAKQFGIADDRIFQFGDWIGGRYSLWSAIGLPLALRIGSDNFNAMLQGGEAIDEHFYNTSSFSENLPIMMGLLGIFRRNVMGASSMAIIPYDERLSYFPRYLQQLMMESNGKQTTQDGRRVDYHTSSVIWGEVGTSAQHSFFQLLHQGTDIIPVDFLLARKAGHHLPEHHIQLMANCLAQSKALAFGKNNLSKTKSSEAHDIFDGDRPSTTLLYDALTPYTLGRLITLYEYKVFVEAMLWDINPFDQWGVELGKELAVPLITTLQNNEILSSEDSSTQGLLASIQKLR